MDPGSKVIDGGMSRQNGWARVRVHQYTYTLQMENLSIGNPHFLSRYPRYHILLKNKRT